jgi:lipopolysaccharide biosynthesis protein
MEERKARLIAFYLPQFHPVPENDEWWGKGFTEWTNVAKAKPLFRGHHQPHLPADLGFYDLRLPEVRDAQANLARAYGIDGFCYWHYWFGNGRRILERPFNEVIKSGKPDFPFCLGWANDTWTGIWHGAADKTLIKQCYPGPHDYEAHFYSVLEALHDKRYMSIHGKKIILIYNPHELPDAKVFTDQWRELAAKEGLNGLHFIAHDVKSDPQKYGCDACVENAPFIATPVRLAGRVKSAVDRLLNRKLPDIRLYSEFVKHMNRTPLAADQYPLIIPNWDNTPRSGENGFVLYGSTPELFKDMLLQAIVKIEHVPDWENRIIFVKAWNEWAEGNHLEPDRQYGHAYLQVIRDCISL